MCIEELLSRLIITLSMESIKLLLVLVLVDSFSSNWRFVTKVQRFCHLRDNVEVRTANFVGRRKRMCKRISSGILLIRSPFLTILRYFLLDLFVVFVLAMMKTP